MLPRHFSDQAGHLGHPLRNSKAFPGHVLIFHLVDPRQPAPSWLCLLTWLLLGFGPDCEPQKRVHSALPIQPGSSIWAHPSQEREVLLCFMFAPKPMQRNSF